MPEHRPTGYATFSLAFDYVAEVASGVLASFSRVRECTGKGRRP